MACRLILTHWPTDPVKRFPVAPEPPLHRADVRDKVRCALRWVRRLAEPTPVPGRTLDNPGALGPQSRATGKWLRHHLLIIHQDYWTGSPDRKSHCRTVSLDPVGMKHVSDRLKSFTHTLSSKTPATTTTNSLVCFDSRDDTSSRVTQPTTPTEVYNALTVDVGDRLSKHTSCVGCVVAEKGIVSSKERARVWAELDRLEFSYQEKSSRLHHPLQNIERCIKSGFWADVGLQHHYDVVACMPELLYQSALKIGCPSSLLEGVLAYLDDRTFFRQKAAAILGCDQEEAKRVVTGLFIVPYINRSPQCKLYGRFGEAAIKLQSDPDFKVLTMGIRRMWQQIKVRSRSFVRNGKAKSALYRSLELVVIKSVRDYLTSRGIKHFLEHDGWWTDVKIDTTDLLRHIKQSTGFDLFLA